jgi:histone H3/H4
MPNYRCRHLINFTQQLLHKVLLITFPFVCNSFFYFSPIPFLQKKTMGKRKGDRVRKALQLVDPTRNTDEAIYAVLPQTQVHRTICNYCIENRSPTAPSSMKECSVTKKALVMVTSGIESYLENLTQNALQVALHAKRKTISGKDVKTVIALRETPHSQTQHTSESFDVSAKNDLTTLANIRNKAKEKRAKNNKPSKAGPAPTASSRRSNSGSRPPSGGKPPGGSKGPRLGTPPSPTSSSRSSPPPSPCFSPRQMDALLVGLNLSAAQSAALTSKEAHRLALKAFLAKQHAEDKAAAEAAKAKATKAAKAKAATKAKADAEAAQAAEAEAEKALATAALVNMLATSVASAATASAASTTKSSPKCRRVTRSTRAAKPPPTNAKTPPKSKVTTRSAARKAAKATPAKKTPKATPTKKTPKATPTNAKTPPQTPKAPLRRSPRHKK